MIEITIENFEQEVIFGSEDKPVLLEVSSQRSEAYSVLGVLLSTFEQEYAGRFILARLDVDAQPQLAQALAQAFGLRSLPTVFMLKNGRPVDGFAGVISEEQLRVFLDKNALSEDALQAEHNKQEAAELAQSGDSQAALVRLQEALAMDPNDDKTRMQYVELLLQEGKLEEAEQAWAPLAPLLSAGGAVAARPGALKVWMDALLEAPGSFEALQAAIEKDSLDYESRFALAQYWLAQDERTLALDELLEIIMRNKEWNEGAARKVYVGILELMTPQETVKTGSVQSQGTIALERQTHELDPQQKLVVDYRRRLSMALN